jgi:hypothetical protein
VCVCVCACVHACEQRWPGVTRLCLIRSVFLPLTASGAQRACGFVVPRKDWRLWHDSGPQQGHELLRQCNRPDFGECKCLCASGRVRACMHACVCLEVVQTNVLMHLCMCVPLSSLLDTQCGFFACRPCSLTPGALVVARGTLQLCFLPGQRCVGLRHCALRDCHLRLVAVRRLVKRPRLE